MPRHNSAMFGNGIRKRLRKLDIRQVVAICDRLSVESVSLCPGTMHTTTTELKKLLSPEEIKRASMRKTNKTFERYFTMSLEDIREMYRKGATKSAPNGRLKLLNLKEKISGEGGIRTHVPRLKDKPISSRPRYGHFGTSPSDLACVLVEGSLFKNGTFLLPPSLNKKTSDHIPAI